MLILRAAVSLCLHAQQVYDLSAIEHLGRTRVRCTAHWKHESRCGESLSLQSNGVDMHLSMPI